LHLLPEDGKKPSSQNLRSLGARLGREISLRDPFIEDCMKHYGALGIYFTL
jgi:hypothetical protein